MKKILLFLFCITQIAYAIRSLPDASKRFQQALNFYTQSKSVADATKVVAEYDSSENTDKYRRTFDATLQANKLTIAQLKAVVAQDAATKAAQAEQQKIMEQKKAQEEVDRLEALKNADEQTAQNAANAQEQERLRLKAQQDNDNLAAARLEAEKAAREAELARQEAVKAREEADKAEAELQEARIKEQQRRAQQQYELAQKMQEEYAASQKDLDDAEKILQEAEDRLSQDDIDQANLELLEGLPLELEALGENKEIQKAAADVDQAQEGVNAAELQADEDLEKIIDEIANLETVNAALDAANKLDDKQIKEQAEAAQKQQNLTSLYAAGGLTLATLLSQVVGIYEAYFPDKAEAFKNSLKRVTGKLTFALVQTGLESLVEKMMTKINTMQADLIDHLVKVDSSRLKLAEYEQELQKKIHQNRKNQLQTFRRTTEIGNIKKRIQEADTILRNIEQGLEKLQASARANGFTGTIRLNAVTQAQYDALKESKSKLESVVKNLQNRNAKIGQAELEINSKLKQYEVKNQQLTQKLQTVIENGKTLSDKVRAELQKPSVLLGTTIDELFRKAGSSAEEIAQYADTLKQKTGQKFASISALVAEGLQQVASGNLSQSLQEALMSGLKRASGGLELATGNVINAPKGSLTETALNAIKTSGNELRTTMKEISKFTQQVAAQDAKTLKQMAAKVKLRAQELQTKATQQAAQLKQAGREAAQDVADYAQTKSQALAQKAGLAKQEISQRAAGYAQSLVKLLKRVPK